MNEPLVSVVIPTYRRTDTLERALNSVLSQTYRNLETIVVDDNAQFPEVREAVRRLVVQTGNQTVRLVENEQNLGGALTRNAGIAAARGEYIAFLDDDDEYLPQRVARQVECFQHSELPKLALVYCHTVMMQDSETPLEEYRNTTRGNCVFEGMRECIAATSQWMCAKAALLDVGCFSDVPCKQDSTVIVKLLVHGYSVDYVPEILSRYYRDAPQSISTQGHEKRVRGEEALRDLCRRHYSLLTKKQQKEVEYASARRLAPHYRALGMKQPYHEALRAILRFPMRRFTLRTLKQLWVNG